jgi:alpha-ribazole phosphatase
VRLYLVRHLQPQVAAGVCYGRSDLAVDPRVLADALPALRARLGGDMQFFSSPLQRCASLANALADPLANPLANPRQSQVRFDARLVELDFGDWELRSWDDIARAQVDAWAADVACYRPGGGESVFDMAQRIDAFYNALMAERLPAAVVVCHAGAIRLLAARIRGLTPMEMAREAAERPHAIGYGEVLVFESV